VPSRWNIAHLEKAPGPVGRLPGAMHCMIAGTPALGSQRGNAAKGGAGR
jgi:hypothetical protein